MKKIITSVKSSNHGKYVVGGVLIGFGAEDTYCALYAGAGVAGALELRNKLCGGKWDWIDFGCTMAGVIVGRLVRVTLLGR